MKNETSCYPNGAAGGFGLNGIEILLSGSLWEKAT